MTRVKKMSRREFLGTTGAAGAGLILGCSLTRPSQVVYQPNAFLAIEPGGGVTIWTAKSEMGQGVKTALSMIVADELDANWEDVVVRQADYDPRFGDQTTGSSLSLRTSWEPLRRAGATAREMLISAAAAEWGVAPATCQTERGEVVHGPSGRGLAFGELTAAASELPVPEDVPLKSPEAFNLIGTSVPRVDTPEKVDGSAVFGLDVKVPGMLYAVVAWCPVFGGDVESVDDAQARAVPGVRDVVRLPRTAVPYPFGNDMGGEGHENYTPAGVAVIAESTWAALTGRRALEVTWVEGPGADVSTESVRAEMESVATAPGEIQRDDGDVDEALASAARTLDAVYELPFQAHAQMEPVNCTADVSADACELWAPTQNPEAAAAAAAQVLGIPIERVQVHVTYLGGGFGRRLAQEYAAVAAMVSRAADAPVKVVWTREDDIQHDYYRQASHHRMRAGLDAQDRLIAWHQRFVTTSISTFFMGPDVPWAAADEVRAQDFPCFTVPNFRVEYSPTSPLVPRGWWRAVEQTFNAFVTESFIDEIAHAAGSDPVAFRLDLIGEPRREPFSQGEDIDMGRLRNVIELVADRADWGGSVPEGRARGIAARFSFGTYVAHVAEVSIGSDGGLRVPRMWCVADCGTVVNPDTVEAQMESGIAFALTAALKGEITVQGGRVEQSNFHDYPMLRIGEMPLVDVHVVGSDEAPGGVGEPGVPSVGPAVANAVFSLTGRRIRKLPILPSDLTEA